MTIIIWLSVADICNNLWNYVLTSTRRSSANHSAWRSIMVVRHVVEKSVEHSVSQSIKEMNDENIKL
jgi:hypothetical protein